MKFNLSKYILLFSTIFLTACSNKSHLGFNSSFFTIFEKSNQTKSAMRSDDQKKNSKTQRGSSINLIESLNQKSISEVEKTLGEPSFIIYNSDIGDDKNAYYFMSWYYVSYELNQNNITGNHVVESSKSLIIRFDSSLHVVGAQVVSHS